MKAVCVVFRSRVDAENAVQMVQSAGVSTDRIAVLTPEDTRRDPGHFGEVGLEAISDPTGPHLLSAVVPGVGMITAMGALGAAVVRAAGTSVEAITGTKTESPANEELPEDEIFVYEEVLRKGGSVFIVIVEEEAAEHLRKLLNSKGAESVDSARRLWWLGLRGAEQEHYSTLNRDFSKDEEFYRLGFEAALHARTRCKEYDQVAGEMNARLEDVQRKYPGVDVEEPFVRGYERGRDYYQGLCNQSTAA